MLAVGKLTTMRIAYPIEIEERDGIIRVRFPDVPKASARSANLPDALAAARQRLIDVLCAHVYEHEDIPRPSSARRCALVVPPLLIAAKLALYQTMRDQNVTNVALARRLGTVEGTVRRLISPRHRSHVETVEQALALLGKRLVLDMWVK